MVGRIATIRYPTFPNYIRLSVRDGKTVICVRIQDIVAIWKRVS
jgi:hypothetical protein